MTHNYNHISIMRYGLKWELKCLIINKIYRQVVIEKGVWKIILYRGLAQTKTLDDVFNHVSIMRLSVCGTIDHLKF